MTMAAATLPGLDLDPDTTVRWFSAHGCVVHGDGIVEVFVGGSLIGSFAPRDRGARNAILVGLAEDPKAHLGKLAKAFGLSSEGLRLVRRQYEREGLSGVLRRTYRGGVVKVTPAVRRRLERRFEQGQSVKSILARERSVKRATVYRLRAEWRARQEVKRDGEPAVKPERQAALPHVEPASAFSGDTQASPEDETGSGQGAADVASDEHDGVGTRIGAVSPSSSASTQHVGTWLMMAMVVKLGLYEAAEGHRPPGLSEGALRVAFDAIIAALSVGERCVEGVRRLATDTGRLLLRSSAMPSASWVRRIIGRFACKRGFWLHLDMGARYLQRTREDLQTPVVFYVDNHLRPYTGKQVVRRGWRMQDKRVLPGATDYYVHDEDGRPVLRLDAPDNAPLTAWLTPVAKILRLALGPTQKVMLAFDRAGAYPEQLAELRDLGFDLVTYERRPYPALTRSAFEGAAWLDGEQVAVHDARINLGKGRGRLRRIAVRFADGKQINLLAVSEQPAQRLLEVMRGRWCQENAFKHGVERWGINQLDGRTTIPYPPETVIPNPARRRLDRALRLARVREGDARRELARLPQDHPRRERVERDLDDSLRQQRELEALRPSTPRRAPLKQTELAGKLVHHTAEYKLTLDAIRIACANAESDLATELAVHLRKPAEAKRVLRNLLSAPGQVRVTARAIAVTLHPAATRNEARAIKAMLATINRHRLALPGDTVRRPLRFRLAQEL